MKVVGNVNNISDAIRPPKLKPGETVVYKLLCGVENPDNEQRKTVPILYPQSKTIPSKDRIWDKGKQDFVDIAIVESVVNMGSYTDIKPRKLSVAAKANSGTFSCTGGNVVEEEIYEFVELTNTNRSNPERDESVEPLFERMDAEKDSKDRSRKRSVLLEAMTYAQSMTDGDVKTFAASVNWNEAEPIDILRDKVEAFAEKDPAGFTKVVEGKDRDAKAIIKRAVDAGKIGYDTEQHRIVLNGQTLIKLERSESTDWLTQAAEFCLHSQKGQKVLTTIKGLLSAKASEE